MVLRQIKQKCYKMVAILLICVTESQPCLIVQAYTRPIYEFIFQEDIVIAEQQQQSGKAERDLECFLHDVQVHFILNKS